MSRMSALAAAVLAFSAAPLFAANYFVSITGSDSNPGTQAAPWRTIQKAASTVPAGSTVYITAGTYNEKVTIKVSGNATAGFTTFRNYGTDKVIVSGSGKTGKHMFYLNGKNYVRIQGLEICNDLNISDGSGIRVEGAGDHLEFRNNLIHDITGSDAMGITIYGTDATKGVTNLVIDGNQVHDCTPADSETITLNGNVNGFQVTNNTVHDVNNIGIDFIGGEGMCSDSSKDAARNGVVRKNTVYHARHPKYASGGIYVDGGHDIVIEQNTSYQNSYGIEIGAENTGIVTQAITVRDNVLYSNDSAGLVFGGYDSSVGRVKNCSFLNNTLWHNDTTQTGCGELWVNYASNNVIQGNILFATSQNMVFYSTSGGTSNTFDYNLYWTASAASSTPQFVYAGRTISGLAALRTASGQNAHSIQGDPQFSNTSAANFKLLSASPAVNTGNPNYTASTELDWSSAQRIASGRIDIGAIESNSSTSTSTSTSPTPTPSPTPTTTSSGTVSLKSIGDAYVRDGSYATLNYANTQNLPVKTSNSSGQNRHAFLQFDISKFTSVQTAKLKLPANLNAGGLVTTNVYGVSDSTWAENTITWNNQPTLGALVASFNVGSTTRTTYTVDVTSYVQGLVSQGKKIACFALVNPSISSPVTQFGSSESTTPNRLVVTGQ
jgi:hypothetical protein